jgi:hypothetical protein
MKKFFDSRWYQVLRKGSETYVFPCAATRSARACDCIVECKGIAKGIAKGNSLDAALVLSARAPAQKGGLLEEMREPCQQRELQRTVSGIPHLYTKRLGET